MEEFFKEIHQLHLTTTTVLQLVVMEYPATMHCSKANNKASLMNCKAEAKLLRFAVHSFVSFNLDLHLQSHMK